MVQAPEEKVIFAYIPTVWEQVGDNVEAPQSQHQRPMKFLITPGDQSKPDGTTERIMDRARYIEFFSIDGQYRTSDPEIIAALDAHPRWRRVQPDEIKVTVTQAELDALRARAERNEPSTRLAAALDEVLADPGDEITWADMPKGLEPPEPARPRREAAHITRQRGQKVYLVRCPVPGCKKGEVPARGLRTHILFSATKGKDEDQAQRHERYLAEKGEL